MAQLKLLEIGGTVFVNPDAIAYLEGNGNKTTIFFMGGSNIQVNMAVSQLALSLKNLH